MSSRFHAAVLLAFALPVGLAAGPVRLAGSDLAAPALQAALQGSAIAPDDDWMLVLAGTRPGFDALRSGGVDLAVVLIESLPAAQDPVIECTPLAYRAPVIVVSDRNPIPQIAMPALAAVLGEGETGNFRRWSELGLPGDWSARTISAHVATGDDPLLLDYLRLRVLKSPRLKASVATSTTTAELLRRLREDESALGILPSLPVDMTGLKAVPVALRAGGIAFGPTPDNVHAGDYPMRMILAVAVVRSAGGRNESGRRVLLSDHVAQALASHGFVPVPSNIRARLAIAVAAP